MSIHNTTGPFQNVAWSGNHSTDDFLAYPICNNSMAKWIRVNLDKTRKMAKWTRVHLAKALKVAKWTRVHRVKTHKAAEWTRVFL
uniref:60S ribosomal protein L28 n=1 Tax=Romanomermis culicivorax TaxID=13658 RepID=A0A915KYG2_ROMCU